MENNKMTTKQALEELKDRANHDEYLFRKNTDTKKALSFLKENNEYIEIIEKVSNALEIIKKKGVFVHLLQQSKDVEEYNSLMLIAFKKKVERDYKGAVEKFCLTKEEYDLLKEVLEHE